MKKLLFMTGICLLMFTSLNAQIEYDMKKPSMEALKAATKARKTGDFLSMRIININKVLYKVEITANLMEIRTNPSAEHRLLFRLPEQDAGEGSTASAKAEAAAEDMDKLSKDAALTADLRADLITLVSDCNKFIKENDKVWDFLKDARSGVILFKSNSSPRTSQAELQSAFSVLDRLITPANKKACDEYCKLYESLDIQYENLKSKFLAGDPANERIVKALEMIEEAHELASEKNPSGIMAELESLKKAVDDPANYVVESGPVQMDGDAVAFHVTVSPADAGAGLESIAWAPIYVPVKGGLKVDFSVGPAFSFGSGALDEKYFFKMVDADNEQLQQRDNKNAIRPSVASQMHFYRRTGSQAAIGFLFGVGAGFQSINDVNLSMYGGVSAILGKERKVMLSTGVSYLRVERLKTSQYNVDDIYPKGSVDLDDVVEKVFKPSAFIAISYALATQVDIK